MDKMLRPASLKQAMSLRRSTAALPVMFRSATPAYTEGGLLDLSGCEEFSRMDTDGVLLHIGAGVTAAELLRDKRVPELLRAAAEQCPADKRDRASLGGALCARNTLTVAALSALDTRVTVASETGRRTMKLRRFLRGNLSVAKDELLCEILVPDRRGGSGVCERCGEDMAFSGFVRWEHRRISELRLAFCGPEGEPIRFVEFEAELIGATVKEAKLLRGPLLAAYERYLPDWEAQRRATLLLQLGSFLLDNNI
ncbi:MAG: FAD binding domain-containing protein [Oscillospiraceae bacterium]|nr:FAD binding domain-containing protein [Oscillospiraceae bacterium]